MSTDIKEASKKKRYNLLVLNEEQQLLKESARDYLKEKAPVSHLRKIRDEQVPLGYDQALWQEMAQMGWAGIHLPEVYGGMAFGFVGLGVLLEEMGRTLTPSPMVSSVLFSATALQLYGTESQKAAYLPGICEGKMQVSLALEEGNHHQGSQVNARISKVGDAYELEASKTFVGDGNGADTFLVLGKLDSGEKAFVLVDAKSEGVQIQANSMVDSRNYAKVKFEKVAIEADQLLGAGTLSDAQIDKFLDIARIGLSAELLGIIQEAFERTNKYLKERHQFGVPIGSFQALQHRAAEMYSNIELCKSVVLKALMAVEDEDSQLAMYASLAKAKTGETAYHVTNEAIQMFGGIGVTDDEEIGFFLKRARAVQQLLGDYNFHLNRFAQLRDY